MGAVVAVGGGLAPAAERMQQVAAWLQQLVVQQEVAWLQHLEVVPWEVA